MFFENYHTIKRVTRVYPAGHPANCTKESTTEARRHGERQNLNTGSGRDKNKTEETWGKAQHHTASRIGGCASPLFSWFGFQLFSVPPWLRGCLFFAFSPYLRFQYKKGGEFSPPFCSAVLEPDGSQRIRSRSATWRQQPSSCYQHLA